MLKKKEIGKILPISIMKYLNKYKYQLGIFLVALVIFITNYSSGKYLVGWDSLQTELNPSLAVTRAFQASWQEYQSFGLPAGMAHSADLIRAIFVWIITFVLPQNIVRYFFHMLMLLVGGLGAFQLFRFCHCEKRSDEAIPSESVLRRGFFSRLWRDQNDVVYFLGALFYMLNLGTIQIFYVPFEPFSIFFAGLPWEIYFFLKYISHYRHPDGEFVEPKDPLPSNRKPIKDYLNVRYFLRRGWFDKLTTRFFSNTQNDDLLKLFLVNLLFTPQSYVQTMFFVYILILGFMSLPFIKNWKKIIVAFLAIFIVNSFWIFPQLYFLKNNTAMEAKINQIATDDVYFQNKEKGTLDNFVKMEGFYFDLFKSDKQELFVPWKNHFEKPYAKYLEYVFALIFLTGIFYKSKYRKSFLLCFGLVSIALLNNTQPFVFVNDIIRQNNLLNQIFRSPFTKFIIPYSLIASYFLVSGLLIIMEVFKGLFRSRRDCRGDKSFDYSQDKPLAMTKCVFSLVVLLLLLLYALPVFTGNFFSTSMKVNIPNDYLETIEYFKTVDKNERISLLPEYTFWGWYYNSWGYNGSGFLWYGIEQPIISRTFDVWSKPSESYFWELKTALESEDVILIKKVFEKYAVNYLILDKSLLPVAASLKGMQIDRIQELLKEIPSIKMVKNHTNLVIYKIDNAIKNYLYTTSDLPFIGPSINLTNQDTAFIENGNYVTQYNKNPDIYYPFLNLFSQTNIASKKWDIKEQADSFLIKSELNFDITNYLLSEKIATTEAVLYKDNKAITYQNNYQILVNKNNLVVKIPKTLIKSYSTMDYKNEKCTQDETTTCFSFDAPFADEKYSYLLSINNKNISGRRFFFYILDKTKKQSYIEDRLLSDNALYILPQKYKYGLGYNFSFQNNNYAGVPSQNVISNLNLYLFPYEAIKNIAIFKPDYSPKNKEINTEIISQKNSYYWYEVQLKNNNHKYLIFNQAYDDGWIAVSSSKNLTHFKISNFANGFDIGNIKNGKVWIIYWPQVLQFLGYLLLLVYYILINYEKNHHRTK